MGVGLMVRIGVGWVLYAGGKVGRVRICRLGWEPGSSGAGYWTGTADVVRFGLRGCGVRGAVGVRCTWWVWLKVEVCVDVSVQAAYEVGIECGL